MALNPKSASFPEEIKALWRDPSFCGSFSGINNFQACLQLEKGISVSKQKLFHILRQDNDFVLELKKIRKKFSRRHMNVHGVGQIWQADLAVMHAFNGFVGFLLCIDVFSHKIFCQPFKSKSQKAIQNCFKKIFSVAHLTPRKLETDQGQEFTANKGFFSERNIFFKIKVGYHKAAFAERAIQTVKRRLYRLLRVLLTQNWPNYLGQTVENINNSQLASLGGLRPNDFKSSLDDPKLDARMGIPEDVSFEEQLQNQKQYEKQKDKFQKGDFVFVDFGPSTFAKGYDSPKYQIYEIFRVDAGKSPPLYKLIDLAGDSVKGFFYGSQLSKANRPTYETFRVEDVLKKRTRNNKEEVYVKYLHYPNKFNQWIPKTNIVKKNAE